MGKEPQPYACTATAPIFTRALVYPEALECYDEAMKYATGANVRTLPDLWRFRSECFSQMEEPDSVFYCTRMALESTRDTSIHNQEAFRAHIIRGHAFYINEHADLFPDSVAPALRALESVNADSMGRVFKSGYLFAAGHAYALLGNTSKGIPMMEEALEMYREAGDEEMIAYGDKILLHTYSAGGSNRGLGRLYLEYEALADSQAAALRSDAVLGADIRYRVREKEAELARARETERLHTSLIVCLCIAVVLGVILMAGASVIAIRHFRSMRRQRQVLRERIENLLTRQKKANATTEELQNAVERLGKELQDRERREQEVNLSAIAELLTPSPLTSENERELRRSFEGLHPRFLRDLRKDYPQLTASDELLCMLIFMKQTNESIALCLGITRMSVNTARFRLRKKLGLDKETDLNGFIAARAS